jgi:hypothetical protein
MSDDLNVENLNAIAARLADHADGITQIALRSLADDLRLAARIAETLAAMRSEIAEIASRTMDSAARDCLQSLLARV